jgi:hypothetical protein
MPLLDRIHVTTRDMHGALYADVGMAWLFRQACPRNCNSFQVEIGDDFLSNYDHPKYSENTMPKIMHGLQD